MSTQPPSPSQENYSLRWNNHQSHILESFDALLQQNSFVDVTLVCADRSLRAHKVVLSACSPFFEKLFNDTPCKHPLIVLKDYQRWIIEAIIDFMYRGEISVPHDRLSQLIQAGESLQIRGLIGAVPEAIECENPMPRRKQARPRRRSEELPEDLSNGQIVTKSEYDDENDQNGSILDENEEELEEKENKPGSDLHRGDVPENLCTKPVESSIGNDKNNNSDGGSKKRQILPPHDFHERFILSLKDLRHLNRYRQGPPFDLLSHLPISPPPSFPINSEHADEKQSADDEMKMESDHSDAETPPFPEQVDLTAHGGFGHEKRGQKMGPMMGHHGGAMPPFPPPFQQADGAMRGGGMHGSGQPSPLQFPGMPSVSALNLTPPHSELESFF